MNDPQEHDGFKVVPVSERKRWKLADLTSSVGAGVLGAGLGMLLPAETRGWAIWILLIGGALHVWGMLDKHRLESGAPRLWWAEALYWACWVILAALLAAIAAQLLWR